MKCLYCGKELAILKRLSGSEFCSDGHRKLYQQEYNQLALNRLISNGIAVESMAARGDTLVLAVPSESARAADAAQEKTPTAAPNGGTNGTAHAPASPARQTHSNSNGDATKARAAEQPEKPEKLRQEKAAEPPVVAPAPTENLPPFADFVDSKPPARLGNGLSPVATPLELVTAAVTPVHPVSHPVDPHADLDRAQPIPFANRSIIARPGAIKIEDRSEPRDFSAPVPKMQRIFLLTSPVLQNLQQPFPIPALPRTAAPASLWTASAERWKQVPELMKESIAILDLEAVEFDFQTLTHLAAASVREIPDVAQEATHPAPAVPAESKPTASPERTTVPVIERVADIVIDESMFARTPRTAPDSIPAKGHVQALQSAAVAEPAPPKVPAQAPKEPGLVETFLPVPTHIATASPAKPISLLYTPRPSAQKGLLPDSPAFPIRPAMAVNLAGKASVATKASAEIKTSAGNVAANNPANAAVNNAGNKEAPVSVPQQPSKPESKAAKSTPQKAAPLTAPQAANRATNKPADIPAQSVAAQQTPVSAAPKPQSQQQKAVAQKVPATTTPISNAAKPEARTPAVTSPAKSQPEKPTAGPVAPPPPKDISLPPFPAKPNESPFANMDLKLPELHITQSKPINPNILYAGAGIAAVVVLAIVALYAFPVSGSSGKDAPASAAVRTGIGAGPDWIENFSPDAARPRTISVLRSTNSYKDYRIEMEAQIDRKALGWVFRAKDAKNFQVAKIELQPLGSNLNPVLVHYAVVNGTAEPRKQVPLGLTVSPSTIYRLRFEASGNKFTAYVQDRRVDEWADPRFPSGGAGLYSDNGERAILQSAFDVTPAATKAN
ncbi:MAG: hypothetical protein ABL995_00235 [Bryobacteraceae bacterium]